MSIVKQAGYLQDQEGTHCFVGSASALDDQQSVTFMGSIFRTGDIDSKRYLGSARIFSNGNTTEYLVQVDREEDQLSFKFTSHSGEVKCLVLKEAMGKAQWGGPGNIVESYDERILTARFIFLSATCHSTDLAGSVQDFRLANRND